MKAFFYHYLDIYRWLFWERNKNHSPNSWRKIWNFCIFTMELISQWIFSLRYMWYTFLNKKKSESLWFCWYCLRNEGFQIFRCEFGELFLFLSLKKSPVSSILQNFDFQKNVTYECSIRMRLNMKKFETCWNWWKKLQHLLVLEGM